MTTRGGHPNNYCQYIDWLDYLDFNSRRTGINAALVYSFENAGADMTECYIDRDGDLCLIWSMDEDNTISPLVTISYQWQARELRFFIIPSLKGGTVTLKYIQKHARLLREKFICELGHRYKKNELHGMRIDKSGPKTYYNKDTIYEILGKQYVNYRETI
jgi:hypothetical protein